MCLPAIRSSVVVTMLLWLAGCGGAEVQHHTPSRNSGAGSGSDGGFDGGSGNGGGCIAVPEICDLKDNDCDGLIDEGFDEDKDGYTTCGGDCDDTRATVNPGGTEVLNDVDDNCDGKVDNGVAGFDYDKDGTAFPADCNDEEPLVGPKAVEVQGDGVDNNCDGKVDEAPAECDGALSGATALEFAKAVGLCAGVTNASFMAGDSRARSIRGQFGAQFTPKEGGKMILVSSGKAVDKIESPTYSPQSGYDFFSEATHPLWTKPRCGPSSSTAPKAQDMSELRLTIQVPQNAKSFTFQFNFFSAEYPEYVCSQFNDRFIAILQSTALPKDKFPNGSGNISFDSQGEVVSINNALFDICQNTSSSSTCTKPVSMLAKTGYEEADSQGRPKGGATGWLTTKAPVTPGETITLRLIILDEGDGILDSAVLIDDFRWEATAVTAPETTPSIN